MGISIAWPVIGERKPEWERSIQFYGYCEVLPDRRKPQSVEKAFREWALKRRLACIDGENMVAFDPKAFNPKDSLDRARFAFLARYFRPRPSMVFQRDLETAFAIRSMYVLEAIQSYWLHESIVKDNGGMIQADPDLLRLMGFSYVEIMQALDGVVKKEYLDSVANGYKLVDPVFGEEFGQYIVNFELLKERFFDGEFMIQVAGLPISLVELGKQMGVDDLDDLRAIMKDAKKRYDLNIEVSEDHVMFGAPSSTAVEHLIGRERAHKEKLGETEVQLKERQSTLKDLLNRYNVREAKILNEIENLREEGHMVYVKGKIATAVQGRIGDGRNR